MQHFLAADFMARGFYQKGAAASRTDQGIDFPEQVFRQENVGALGGHVYIFSVLYLCAFVNTHAHTRTLDFGSASVEMFHARFPAPPEKARSFG